jgi:hypothetical protein
MKPIVNKRNIEELLIIYGDENSEVCPYYGNILNQNDIIKAPISIQFSAHPQLELYTLILIGVSEEAMMAKDEINNPDCIVFWLIYNSDYSKNSQDEKVGYLGPPDLSKSSGRVRYMFLMYRQKNRIKNILDSLEFDKFSIKLRPTIKIRDLEIDYNLELVAANTFYCEKTIFSTVEHVLYQRSLDEKPKARSFLPGPQISIKKPNYLPFQVKDNRSAKKRRRITSAHSSTSVTRFKQTAGRRFIEAKRHFFRNC